MRIVQKALKQRQMFGTAADTQGLGGVGAYRCILVMQIFDDMLPGPGSPEFRQRIPTKGVGQRIGLGFGQMPYGRPIAFVSDLAQDPGGRAPWRKILVREKGADAIEGFAVAVPGQGGGRHQHEDGIVLGKSLAQSIDIADAVDLEQTFTGIDSAVALGIAKNGHHDLDRFLTTGADLLASQTATVRIVGLRCQARPQGGKDDIAETGQGQPLRRVHGRPKFLPRKPLPQLVNGAKTQGRIESGRADKQRPQ